jgi:serralysin
MAIRFIGNDTDGVDADANGDTWILQEAAILSNSADAFDFGTFASCTLIVEGSVYCETDAIDSDSGSSNNTVVVSETGFVYGESDGIEMSGDTHEIFNHGEVTGLNDRGIQMIGGSGRVTNTGTVYGQSDGISLEGDNNNLVNTGTITSQFDGVNVDGTGNHVFNSGLISGERYGFEFNTSVGEANTLINTGTIVSNGATGVAIQGDFARACLV